jgi:hypothetical protein
MKMLKMIAGVALGAGLLAAQALNVKTGQWETTTTTASTGAAMPALPPGALDRLPPEQRARIEAQIKAVTQGRTSTSTYCLTPEQASKGFRGADLPKSCTYNLTVSTASQQKMTVACETDKAKTTGTVQVDVISPDSVKGTVQMATALNGQPQPVNMNITFSSKWLGPACAETNTAK